MEKFGMNRQSAKEWLIKAWHNLSGAKIFYDVNHYTDTTAVELHYAVEKMLKSIIVYQNRKIPKTHDLSKIHSYIMDMIDFDEAELELLDIISEYHIKETYPTFDRQMPSREEIKEVLDFSEKIFDDICKVLYIDRGEIVV
ncbi:MAG: HEPN domain-containing protein [Epsilonproteobacteria bacterium]|nr:HEPN domain-containing protein [Campylobacterota bacterium]